MQERAFRIANSIAGVVGMVYYANNLGFIQCLACAAIGLALDWVLKRAGMAKDPAAGWGFTSACVVLIVWDLRVRIRTVRERGESFWHVLSPSRGGVLVIHTFLTGIGLAVLCVMAWIKG